MCDLPTTRWMTFPKYPAHGVRNDDVLRSRQPQSGASCCHANAPAIHHASACLLVFCAVTIKACGMSAVSMSCLRSTRFAVVILLIDVPMLPRHLRHPRHCRWMIMPLHHLPRPSAATAAAILGTVCATSRHCYAAAIATLTAMDENCRYHRCRQCRLKLTATATAAAPRLFDDPVSMPVAPPPPAPPP